MNVVCCVQMLENLRQEMLLMSKFEGMVDSSGPTDLEQYVRAVKTMCDTRAAMAEKFLGQFGLNTNA